MTLYTIDNLIIHKLLYMDLQCDLAIESVRIMHACMRNFELAVLCMCRCVPVPPVINLRARAGYFFDIICKMGNLLYPLETFCKIHGKCDF